MMEAPDCSDMQTLLGQYIDFDFVDWLAEPKRKRDGRYYATYLGVLKPDYAPLVPGIRTLVIKEIMPAQMQTYCNLSSVWSPYLETVYGILPMGDCFIALNEFIRKPSCLCYTDEALRERHSLSLEDYICYFGCLSKQEALVFMLQLCEGIEALKKFHIVHGDISPQNILLTDRFSLLDCPYPKLKGIHHAISVKIIDFDIAREQKGIGHLVTSVEGTRLFAAPEILDYQSPTDRVDIYSLGCILSYMLTGKSPKQFTPKQLREVCGPRIWRVIEKCTLDYSHRYRSITLLKREIRTTIAILCPSNFLHRIPGFRLERFGPMCVAACGYACLFLMFCFVLMEPEMGFEMLVICLMPILGFDIFRLGELSYTYISYRDRHPWMGIVVRLILGCLLLIILLLFS